MEKINRYQIDELKNTITVELDKYSLKIIVDALCSAEYEGVISTDERDDVLNILNIDIY